MQKDIEIAQSCKMLPIVEIARRLGIGPDCVENYGAFKAKIDPRPIRDALPRKGRLVLVTAMTPTPAGEGKTTTSIGLTDALNRIGKSAVAALREPSLGPVFGLKGGAAGGGWAQLVPMEDINLHFTGDFHAIGAANNLLAAMLDNHIHQGNALGIDPRRIVWRRCVDMNDRQLRNIVSGLGGPTDGMPREDGFDITVASEVMAALCLSEDLRDLKERLGRIIVGYTRLNEPVTASQLKAAGAMAVLLKDAIRPNLVQTLEHSPAFVHGGPFANIAHGCNSVAATDLALRLGEYCVTEAGFGADLGAEKFIDIKCRAAGLRPDAAVLVATVRALKFHGGQPRAQLSEENLPALSRGMANLYRHAENLKTLFGLNCVVAFNRFPTDSEAELSLALESLAARDIRACLSEAWEKGGAGAVDLARAVVDICEEGNDFRFAYETAGGIEEKLNAVARKVYRARRVDLSGTAAKQLKRLEALGFGALPVCFAKTQYSFSDDPTLLGAPEDFAVTVRNLKVCAGAGFIVALTGDIMTMPGLPKVPAAENIDLSDDGVITGLF